MAITANFAGLLALRATTALPPGRALEVVKMTCEAPLGGWSAPGAGDGLLPGLVCVENEAGERLTLSLRAGPLAAATCAFPAWARRSGALTTLRLGELERSFTSPASFAWWHSPCPPSEGDLAVYRSFLDGVASALQSADPGARVTIGQGV